MERMEEFNFKRIEKAIEYIRIHFKEQPSLRDVAEYVGISEFHFQRMFTEWVGISPKKFQQYISLEYAKQCLQRSQSILELSDQTGFTSPSRVYDLFVSVERMTPGEFKSDGIDLTIRYAYYDSPFGEIIIVSTGKGVCAISFVDDRAQAFSEMRSKFPKAQWLNEEDDFQLNAAALFTRLGDKPTRLSLHLKGTDFQLKVWEMLMKIPEGKLTTYGALSAFINNPGASRAVGTAIGSNPIAYLIPCHRVIQSSGVIGGYRWGTNRKTAIIAWEAAQTEIQE